MKINGRVTNDGKPLYMRMALISPVAHYYNEPDEPDYIKYSCPICDMLKVKHSISIGDPSCFLCGVNLDWKNVATK